MKALITGASSGIGKDMAVVLNEMGYDLILVSRSRDKLEQLSKSLNGNIKIIPLDLSEPKACFELYEKTKDEGIDVLINNAGYAAFGEFCKTPLETELNLIDLNIKAVHILSKLFLKDFMEKDKGYILNVASVAGVLGGGPLLSSYYASKAYVVRLSQAIYEELRRRGSHVSVSVLCPGPVDTNFNERAGVRFAVKGMNSLDVAKYAIDSMLKGKLMIFPGAKTKAGAFLRRFAPEKLLLRLTYDFQKAKE
ncbi:MAG TPA: SDR family oxidoreductase [Oscillospiraceae bacterium]|nr:SDR family oxidoreductase [Oscillospiraceae bacterium]